MEGVSLQNLPVKKPKLNFWKVGSFLELLAILFLLFLLYGASLDSNAKYSQISKLEQTCLNVTTKKQSQSSPTISSWKEFSNPRFPFSFKYPSNWFERILEENFVAVSNYPDQCSKCTEQEKRNFYSFVIIDRGELTGDERTSSAVKFVLKGMLTDGYACEVEEKCPPIIPGPMRYKDNADGLFKPIDASISAVEVYPYDSEKPLPEEIQYSLSNDCGDFYGLIDNQYYLIKNYHLYEVGLVSPGYQEVRNKPNLDEDHPLIEIIKSLKLK